MSLDIKVLSLGPMENNTAFLIDTDIKECIIVDPSFGIAQGLAMIEKEGLKIKSIWLTHAHFDHTCGITEIFGSVKNTPEIALHPADLDLYRDRGGAGNFNFTMPSLPLPTKEFSDSEKVSFGGETIEVRHAPGHSQGHVIFYFPQQGVLLSGDVLFNMGIGRTDLPGGSYKQLLNSVQTQIFTLPDETIVYPGHGPRTTVGFEKRNNPYLAG